MCREQMRGFDAEVGEYRRRGPVVVLLPPTQINDHAGPGVRDGAQRGLQSRVAITVQRAEGVAGQTFRVYVNGQSPVKIAVHERHVFGAVLIPIPVRLEFPCRQGKPGPNRSGDHCRTGSAWRTAEQTPSLAAAAATRSADGVP